MIDSFDLSENSFCAIVFARSPLRYIRLVVVSLARQGSLYCFMASRSHACQSPPVHAIAPFLRIFLSSFSLLPSVLRCVSSFRTTPQPAADMNRSLERPRRTRLSLTTSAFPRGTRGVRSSLRLPRLLLAPVRFSLPSSSSAVSLRWLLCREGGGCSRCL